MRRPARITLDSLYARVVGRPQLVTASVASLVQQVLDRRLRGERLTDDDLEAIAQRGESAGAGARGELGIEVGPGERQGVDGDPDADPGYAIVDGVAVVPVVGMLVKDDPGIMRLSIGPCTVYSELAAAVETALAEREVRGVLLCIDSGGGESAGCFETVDELVAMRAAFGKPIGAYVDGLAASGAYALACAADAGLLVCPEAGEVGSIGAFSIHTDETAMHAASGLRHTVLRSHDYKGVGTPYAPLSDEHREYLTDGVRECAAIFARKVAARRGLSVAAIDALQARVLYAEQAKQAGLIDAIGSARFALELVLQAADDASGFSPTDPPVLSTHATPQNGAAKTVLQEPETMPILNKRKAPSPAVDAPPLVEDPDTPPAEEEPMTAAKLRELYPDAVAEIEADARKTASEGEEEEETAVADVHRLKALLHDDALVVKALTGKLTIGGAMKLAGEHIATLTKERDAARALVLESNAGVKAPATGVRTASALPSSESTTDASDPDALWRNPKAVASFAKLTGREPAAVTRGAFVEFVKACVARGDDPFPDLA